MGPIQTPYSQVKELFRPPSWTPGKLSAASASSFRKLHSDAVLDARVSTDHEPLTQDPQTLRYDWTLVAPTPIVSVDPQGLHPSPAISTGTDRTDRTSSGACAGRALRAQWVQWVLRLLQALQPQSLRPPRSPTSLRSGRMGKMKHTEAINMCIL